ncbi:hypothetical protein ACEPPN_007380 [Leptodophora sp. 'Broadleaf-Isolate-01']
MGSTFSRSPREHTREQNHTTAAIIERQGRELAELREQTGTLHQFELAYQGLTDKFEAAGQRVEALTAENKALGLSRDESARQVKELQFQIEKLESENEDMLLELKSADDEKQRLEGQADVLRGMITKNRELNGTQVDDNTIATSFMRLRDQIQGIALKLCSGKSDKDVLQDELSTPQSIYFAHWQGGSSQSQLRNRTRAAIFDMVYNMILRQECFGLENLGENSEVERGLMNFESAMNRMSQGHEDDVAEWRTQTMRCASFLQLESTMPGQTVGAIRHFFAPLWPQPPAEDKLHALVTQLCKDAFSLAMLLRSCKDVYRCEFPPPRSRLTEDTEPQERELRQEDMSDGLTDQDIAYNLSGMLVKYPQAGRREASGSREGTCDRVLNRRRHLLETRDQ